MKNAITTLLIAATAVALTAKGLWLIVLAGFAGWIVLNVIFGVVSGVASALWTVRRYRKGRL